MKAFKCVVAAGVLVLAASATVRAQDTRPGIFILSVPVSFAITDSTVESEAYGISVDAGLEEKGSPAGAMLHYKLPEIEAGFGLGVIAQDLAAQGAVALLDAADRRLQLGFVDAFWAPPLGGAFFALGFGIGRGELYTWDGPATHLFVNLGGFLDETMVVFVGLHAFYTELSDDYGDSLNISANALVLGIGF